jgi:hypothetical protein
METRKILAVILVVLALYTNAFSQNIGVAINSDGAAPNNSSILDVSSTTKGFAPPRMTHAQKLAIASPATGLIVWCSNCGSSGELQIFNGTTWTNTIGGAASGITPGAPTIGTATAGNAQATVTFTQPASNGGSAITSYTATSSPGGLTGTLSQAGSGTITVTGLTNGTAYTFTVTATTVSGNGPASAASNIVTPAVVLKVGDSYQGGIIFYIFVSGDLGYVAGQTHGLIAATSDQSTGIAWITGGSTQTTVNGLTKSTLGKGQANTNYMIAQTGYTGGAAKVCDNYSITANSVTYSDWYLPSKEELNKLYLQKTAVGGFTSGWYWSSSEGSNSIAWIQNSIGVQGYLNKANASLVRAVRTF